MSEFVAFTMDQEYITSLPKNNTFDYVEGLVIQINKWRSSYFSPQNPVKVISLDTNGHTWYCLEMTKNYNNDMALIRYLTNTLKYFKNIYKHPLISTR